MEYMDQQWEMGDLTLGFSVLPALVASNAGAAKTMRTDGVCHIASANLKDSSHRGDLMGYDGHMQEFLPKDWVRLNVGKGSYSSEAHQKYSDWSESLKVTVTRAPQHGEMVLDSTVDNIYPSYLPQVGYLGKDRVEVEIKGVDFEGKPIAKKVIFFIQVVPSERIRGIIDNYKVSLQKYCGTSQPTWKISQSGQSNTSSSDLAAWQRSATLSALIANAQQSVAGFTGLPATALGQTVGEGATATITLDQNAAGHNWYIDPTPLDNTDDYLPTSDPTVFKAKAGSAAAGKMDMLSVLLHEYGHALGLEHSANGADFMAASLQPGVRKLPSAAELTLMARLVAELKNAGGEALTLALSQGERGQVQGDAEQDPSNPSSPLPSPSHLSALGLLPFGFMRRNDGKGSANEAVATGAATASPTSYLTAINTTLANGSFSARQNGTIDQWESVGNVAAAPAAAFQAVTLGESTSAQAHLAQAFVLSAQDRFLTFTVSGLDLQTNSIEQGDVFTAAPQDAFEVALQNANTGANLLANGAGGVGNYPF